MTVTYFVATAVLMFLEVVAGGTSCQCEYVLRPDQNKYCESNFVIEATVVDKQVQKKNDMIRYTVDVKHSFKSKKGKKYFGTYTLLSKKSRDQCGVNSLEVDKTYVLSGIESKIKRRYVMQLDLCKSVVIEANKATDTQRENLRNYFKLQCPKCRVELCVPGQECRESPYKCVINYFNYTCHNMYSICHWTGYKCEWRHINRNKPDYDSSCMPRFQGHFGQG